MKVFANDDRNVFITATFQEWDSIQQACGIPYDKRSKFPNSQANAEIVAKTVEALRSMKGLRKELGSQMKKWDQLAGKVDEILGTE